MTRYAGAADRIVLYFAGLAWAQDPDALGRWGEIAAEVRRRTTAGR